MSFTKLTEKKICDLLEDLVWTVQKHKGELQKLRKIYQDQEVRLREYEQLETNGDCLHDPYLTKEELDIQLNEIVRQREEAKKMSDLFDYYSDMNIQ